MQDIVYLAEYHLEKVLLLENFVGYLQVTQEVLTPKNHLKYLFTLVRFCMDLWIQITL